MNLKEKGLNDMGVIDLFQDRKKPWNFANTIMNIQAP